jgi:hypothetical protein
MRPVLVLKEEYPERTTDHGQANGKLYHMLLRVECTLFVTYKAGPFFRLASVLSVLHRVTVSDYITQQINQIKSKRKKRKRQTLVDKINTLKT